MRRYGVYLFIYLFIHFLLRLDPSLPSHCKCRGYCWCCTFSDTHTHTHTHTHTYTQSVEIFWTRDRPVAETSTWQHTTFRRQISIPPVGFELAITASERPQTNALDRAATGIGCDVSLWLNLKISVRFLQFLFFFRWERRWLGSLMKLACLPHKCAVLGWGSKYRW